VVISKEAVISKNPELCLEPWELNWELYSTVGELRAVIVLTTGGSVALRVMTLALVMR
jgi:hypothetical protein